MTHIKIIRRPSGIYDVYDRETGEHMFSRSHPDNVFAKLDRIYPLAIYFVDEQLSGGREEDRFEPTEVRSDGWRTYCPICGKQQKSAKHGIWYCERCGQALKKVTVLTDALD